MKHLKKKMVVLFCITLMLFMCACTKTISYTFNIETGDSIKVEMTDSSGEYSLTQENGTFAVSKGETTVLQGFFVTEDLYNQYLESMEVSGAEVLTTATANGCTYVEYSLVTDTHTENDFICWIDGSSTGVVLGSMESQTEAESAFGLLTFSVE